MKTIVDVVNNKISSMIEDGSIEDVLERAVEATLTDTIKNSLKSYSEFGRMIEKTVKESLNFETRKIELPAYGKFIIEIVEREFLKVLEANALAPIVEKLESIVAPIKKTMKVSELLEEIREAIGDGMLEDGENIIHISCEYRNQAMYVTFKDSEILATFYNFKKPSEEQTWHIGYLNYDGNKFSGNTKNMASVCCGTVGDILFRYYTMNTEFTLDDDFEDIELIDY
jgi:hypothetical protein